MSVADLSVWAGFFGILAQIGATLAGLLFVGLTISLEHLIASRGYLARGFTALALQFEILIVGVLGVVPGQSAMALGVELILTGLVVLAGVVAFAHNFPEDENSTVLATRGPTLIRAALTATATLAPVIAGAGLILGWRGALYALIPAVIAAVYLSIGYAWIFAIEIPRRRDAQKKPPAP
jgi:hypothetical protein